MVLFINSYHKIQANIFYFGGLVQSEILASTIWGPVISSSELFIVVTVGKKLPALVRFVDINLKIFIQYNGVIIKTRTN